MSDSSRMITHNRTCTDILRDGCQSKRGRHRRFSGHQRLSSCSLDPKENNDLHVLEETGENISPKGFDDHWVLIIFLSIRKQHQILDYEKRTASASVRMEDLVALKPIHFFLGVSSRRRSIRSSARSISLGFFIGRNNTGGCKPTLFLRHGLRLMLGYDLWSRLNIEKVDQMINIPPDSFGQNLCIAWISHNGRSLDEGSQSSICPMRDFSDD